MSTKTPAEIEAQRLFDLGYGITSRKYRMASRCPPELAKGMTTVDIDYYRRVKSKDTIVVSVSVMKVLLQLQGRGLPK